MSGQNIITSAAYVLHQPNIDTDQIIPARFLTTTTRDGLGEHAFAGWRTSADGSANPSCVFNDPAFIGANIIVAGHNFGCGSSREHAAWALHDLGVRAVISPEIADIFKSNAIKNGIVPVEIAEQDHTRLMEHLVSHPHARIAVDVQACAISWDADVCSFSIDEFGRRCLLDGVDAMGWLLKYESDITRYEEQLQCVQ